MKKYISKFILMLVMVFAIGLTGCEGEQQEVEVNTLTVEKCMKQDNIKSSVKGETLTYYFKSNDEISLYYVDNWNRGRISLKKYFVNKEKYEMQKELNKDAKCNDKELTIYIKEYSTVEDMDAYWNEIENSDVYILVK